MDAAAELGRNPVSKHQIQPEYGDEQADRYRSCTSGCSTSTRIPGTDYRALGNTASSFEDCYSHTGVEYQVPVQTTS